VIPLPVLHARTHTHTHTRTSCGCNETLYLTFTSSCQEVDRIFVVQRCSTKSTLQTFFNPGSLKQTYYCIFVCLFVFAFSILCYISFSFCIQVSWYKTWEKSSRISSIYVHCDYFFMSVCLVNVYSLEAETADCSSYKTFEWHVCYIRTQLQKAFTSFLMCINSFSKGRNRKTFLVKYRIL